MTMKENLCSVCIHGEVPSYDMKRVFCSLHCVFVQSPATPPKCMEWAAEIDFAAENQREVPLPRLRPETIGGKG